MRKFINQLIPFLLAGIAISAFVFGILLLAYLFLFGAIVGSILFIIAWIRHKFFPPKLPTKRSSSGRIIDADHWEKM